MNLNKISQTVESNLSSCPSCRDCQDSYLSWFCLVLLCNIISPERQCQHAMLLYKIRVLSGLWSVPCHKGLTPNSLHNQMAQVFGVHNNNIRS